MNTRLITAMTCIIFLFASCNYNKPGNEKQDNKIEPANVMDLQSKDKQEGNPENNKQVPVVKLNGLDADSLPAVTSNNYVDWDKKIIKTATMRLEIKDFKKYNSHVHEIAKRYGAYIADEEQNLTDYTLENVMSIKVPVAQFDNLVNVLPADDAKVQERKISSDDVGSEMADTKSRLEAKKQVRQKYLEFLKQSKNMTEVLQVQNEINQIQEDIEAATGRMNFLSKQSAYSTINLSFYQPMQGYDAPADASSFLTRVTSSFKTGANWIKELVIGLIAVWPMVLLLAAGYFLWKKNRRNKLSAQKIKTATATV